ncbi:MULTISPECIES: FHA domain-containing protein [unclassified Isoptericola]|uniref:FHA domain-containing protein FhaB/FipA n=1 Tax=unclassified Isoptericola TaxID=2623355 RepID=UPI002713EEDA|nr:MULTISPECIES: FHA domain-containing protein [unclassified Isoptericola]MDO8143734.1 FHA domain-containing protein [Isoptericola sp. 178]MDO8147635.1 FHA domain-containing protein [Isoptericola sp. b515]MDO8150065.1 FHA domain-containing protein [Isoptericola sp. b408]
MSELTFTLLRLGYLVLLWVFVLSAVAVLRRDLALRGTPRAPKKSDDVAAAAAPVAAPRPSGRSGPTRLVVTQGPLTGTTLPLSGSSILIGRAPSCTLVLDDDYSSSRHARIFPQGDQWYVEDLGSTNGTYLGDQRVSSPAQLAPGVGVQIGRSVVELQG